MAQAKGFHGLKTKGGKIAVNTIVTLIFGALYFYFSLPAINLHDRSLYVFVGLLCVVYFFCALITSGVNLSREEGVKGYFRFIKNQCLPMGILFAILIVVAIFGAIISMPILRSGAYRDLLTVETGDFSSDVEQVSYNEIPMLDEASAQRLGDRKLGELSDMVSQFEVSDDYTQINYLGRPVRVTYLQYGDFFKWLNNRSEGLPAYIRIDMVTQEVEVQRLSDLGLGGIKYSPTELFGRKLERHLRFNYPTFMFSDATFEIDENGHPYWVCPKIEMTIGLFGGKDIDGAVLVDAISGECAYYAYEEVPTWVDRVYLASLIMEQYDYHGTYINGFLNSIFGQRDVTVTTAGYNYIAMNDDVYMYTGVTSVSSDQSNIGFLLSNQRTKETVYYAAPGAVEQSAINSAEGMVQDLGYEATWPLLLNVSGEPTYFMSLKDASQLVKQYAMVNVAQYQIVATGVTVAECESNYLKLLAQAGISTEEDLQKHEAEGIVEEIRTMVVEGTTYFCIRLTGENVFYAISAANYPEVIALDPGEYVWIEHQMVDQDNESPLLNGYSIRFK